MVEDALKVTRNLQRLLLVACVVAIVFLASLRDIGQEQALLGDLSRLPTLFDDEKYGRWVEEVQAEQLRRDAASRAADLLEELQRRLPGAFDVDSLIKALGTPAHLSRASLPRLDLEEHSVSDLVVTRGPNVLAFARLAFADTGGDLPTRLADAISEAQPSGRASIRDAQLRLRDPLPDDRPHAFLDVAARSKPLELYFVVNTPGRASPVYTLEVDAKWYGVPESSVVNWWTSKGHFPTDLIIRFRAIDPPLDSSKSLAELREDVAIRVLNAQAANRTIDLAGISIPGSLALFGIPAILLGFAGALLIHLRHLHRLAADHRQTFRQFSWTPVSPGELWLWETTALLLVLPVAVHLLLVYRAPAFGGSPLLPMVAGFAGAVGAALAGVALLRSIGRLRRRLYLR